jgi:putative hydrolase of HD superfamily
MEFAPESDRLARQIAFLVECDRLKSVLRQTLNVDGARHENSAEHSWAICLFAMTLAEHSNVRIDIARVLQMLVVHDLVEIDAGDTFAYDTARLVDQYERESRAADRIFGMLPSDQASAFRALWEEFEAQDTAESKFAMTVDRLQPMLLNCLSEGASWRRHGVTHAQVVTRNSCMESGSVALWTHIRNLVDEAVQHGYLDGDPA